jgi:hypothetical protein
LKVSLKHGDRFFFNLLPVHIEDVCVVQAKHYLALGEGGASVHGITPTYCTRHFRGSRVNIIGLRASPSASVLYICAKHGIGSIILL